MEKVGVSKKYAGVLVKTRIDHIYSIVRKKKEISISELADIFGIHEDLVEFLGKILQKKGLIEIDFPAVGRPFFKLKRLEKDEKEVDRKGKIVDNYMVFADNVPALIEIIDMKGESVPLYEINMPKLGPGLLSLMDYLIEKLTRDIKVSVEEIVDPKKMVELRGRFFKKALVEVKNIFSKEKVDGEIIEILAGVLLHRMYGLGYIDIIIADDLLEEITINNSSTPLVVYHKKHGWLKTNKQLKSEEEIYNLASEIGRKVQREITTLNPLMDAHLLTGDRIAATLFPISTFGNTITIRKFARSPWTISQFVSPELGTISKEIAAFLWQAMEYEMNIMVAGGTASGKTSILNCISALIPPTQRIISIEDTREIMLPSYMHWNWVPLTTRNPNPEGQGAVDMLSLIVSSLRMRPDRIIVGEVRTRRQAETMFEAMHTGHAVYSTIHADNAEQVKRRLLEPPFEIPKNEVEALHLILIQHRNRRKNLRRTLELAEVLSDPGKTLALNYLYRWYPKGDGFEKVNDSIRIMEELNLNTGMSMKEMKEDLLEREKILDWMVKKEVTNVEHVGFVMKTYYEDPAIIVKAVEKNMGFKQLNG
jgi:flagellar protein FlaI